MTQRVDRIGVGDSLDSALYSLRAVLSVPVMSFEHVERHTRKDRRNEKRKTSEHTLAGRHDVTKLLILGADTVAGANLAASLSDRSDVVALSTDSPVNITGCQTTVCQTSNALTVRDWIARIQPKWVIYSSGPARSNWSESAATIDVPQMLADARSWITEAAAAGCRLTVISSDAVFTGPWMFHDERSRCWCPSDLACAIRKVEQCALDECPKSLVVRTNVFGWSPGNGWLEQILEGLEQQAECHCDAFRYATPILATDLAALVWQAMSQGLSGLYHLAGAERVSPAQFVQRLAAHFGLPAPRFASKSSLSDRPEGFGRGETSLQSLQIRKALGAAVPMLCEGLDKLAQQADNGHREQFSPLPLREKVA